jgi:hypothetical protein
MILWRCDGCPKIAGPDDDADWIIVNLVTAAWAHGGPDDEGQPVERPQHFCSWRCAGVYATARALLEQP